MSTNEKYNSTTYEVSIVHPAVIALLESEGYSVQHHVRLIGVGVIDFVATATDGSQLIVEAKVESNQIPRAITQVIKYRDVYNPDASIAIAIPHDSVTSKAYDVCERRNSRLILVDVPLKITRVKDEVVMPISPDDNWQNWFLENCLTDDGIDFSKFGIADYDEFNKFRNYFWYLKGNADARR